MPRTKKEQVVFNGTGRRKSSIARVRIMSGKGNITVNGKALDEYFGEETLKVIVRQPLTVTDTLEYRPALKSNGFLTRDSRAKERKKYGLKKARKAPQFSKR